MEWIADDHRRPDRRSGETSQAGPETGTERRRWLGIMFRCCQIYGRIYKNAPGTAYDGFCPRCGNGVHIAVGQGGTSHRFFEAG